MRSLQREVYVDYGDMMSEYFAGDDSDGEGEIGAGPFANSGCLVVIAATLGAAFWLALLA